MVPRIPVPCLVISDFLSSAEHADLLRWTLANEGQFDHGRIGDGSVDRERKRCEKLDDLGPLSPVFRGRIAANYAEWLKTLKVSPFELGRLELQIAAYMDQAIFSFHTDATLATSRYAGRAVTAIYYFYREPKGFTGGDLRLFDIGTGPEDGKFRAVEPVDNTLVLFPSWIGHDVTRIEVGSGEFGDSRFTVNCWLNRA